MKTMKRILVLLLVVAGLLLLTSCSLFHQHEWQYRVVKDATCSEKGLLEILCTGCGEKQYADLEPDAHSYVGNVCIKCGTHATAKQMTRVTLTLGTDTSGKWSFQSIYDLARTFGYSWSYSSFMSSLTGNSLKQAYLDSLGFFHVTVSSPNADGSLLETPLALPIQRVEVTNPLPSLGRLLRADVEEGGELVFTYADASRCSAGSFTAPMSITGFAISTEGELVIFYGNGMIAFAGTIG